MSSLRIGAAPSSDTAAKRSDRREARSDPTPTAAVCGPSRTGRLDWQSTTHARWPRRRRLERRPSTGPPIPLLPRSGTAPSREGVGPHPGEPSNARRCGSISVSSASRRPAQLVEAALACQVLRPRDSTLGASCPASPTCRSARREERARVSRLVQPEAAAARHLHRGDEPPTLLRDAAPELDAFAVSSRTLASMSSHMR